MHCMLTMLYREKNRNNNIIIADACVFFTLYVYLCYICLLFILNIKEMCNTYILSYIISHSI